MTAAVRFHFRNGFFAIRETFSDVTAGITGFLLFPYFLFILTKIWERFSASQGNMTRPEMLAYVAVTEILFMTFFFGGGIMRSAADFSLSLARPRSWLMMQFSTAFGRCLGSRLIYMTVALVALPLLGASVELTVQTLLRLLVLLPLMGILQGLCLIILASAEVMWEQTQYLILPISKIFLALGGVLSPLVDYGEPWRSWLIPLPPADWFFQPAYWCVRGETFGVTVEAWLARIFASIAVVTLLAVLFYRLARRQHQSYGG